MLLYYCILLCYTIVLRLNSIGIDYEENKASVCFIIKSKDEQVFQNVQLMRTPISSNTTTSLISFKNVHSNMVYSHPLSIDKIQKGCIYYLAYNNWRSSILEI
ncbi:hypothetical protein ECANGB1_1330 [Enterospora canceri]|uniref:Uncharacterized protein n=1 Tax=Enterospora canceri TaxID=1081671 RepID=A0A1Y1S412_9MICR|nr:hypothetical protein ECANGB1_1330 [Enterospora canceri]